MLRRIVGPLLLVELAAAFHVPAGVALARPFRVRAGLTLASSAGGETVSGTSSGADDDGARLFAGVASPRVGCESEDSRTMGATQG